MTFKHYLKFTIAFTLLQQSTAVYADQPIQTISPQRIMATAAKPEVVQLMKNTENLRQQIEEFLNNHFEVIAAEQIGYIQGSFEQFTPQMRAVVTRRPSLLRGIAGAALLALIGAGLGFGIGAIGLVAASGALGGATIATGTAATMMAGGAIAGGAAGGMTGAQYGQGSTAMVPGGMIKTGQGKIEGETYQINDTARVFSAIIMDKVSLQGYLDEAHKNNGNEVYSKAINALISLASQRSTLTLEEGKQIVALMDQYNKSINDLSLAGIDLMGEDSVVAGQIQSFVNSQNDWRRDKRVVISNLEIDPSQDFLQAKDEKDIAAVIADKSTPVASYLTKSSDFHLLFGQTRDAKLDQAITKENEEMQNIGLASVVMLSQFDGTYGDALKGMLSEDPHRMRNYNVAFGSLTGGAVSIVLAGMVWFATEAELSNSAYYGSFGAAGASMALGGISMLVVKDDHDYLLKLAEEIQSDSKLEADIQKSTAGMARALNLNQDKTNRLNEAIKKEMATQIIERAEYVKKTTQGQRGWPISDDLSLDFLKVDVLGVAVKAGLIDAETETSVKQILKYVSELPKGVKDIDIVALLSLNRAVLKAVRTGLVEIQKDKNLKANQINATKFTLDDIDRHLAYADTLLKLAGKQK